MSSIRVLLLTDESLELPSPNFFPLGFPSRVLVMKPPDPNGFALGAPDEAFLAKPLDLNGLPLGFHVYKSPKPAFPKGTDFCSSAFF